MKILFFKADITTHTPRQLLAGNYKKRKVEWRGLTISVEVERGELRTGFDKDHKVTWAVRMAHPYGYILRTLATDGEQVDCFLGPELESAPYVYIVHARRYGAFHLYDEDKCFLGFPSKSEAIKAFQAAYPDERFMGEITTLEAEDFKRKVLETANQRTAADRRITA